MSMCVTAWPACSSRSSRSEHGGLWPSPISGGDWNGPSSFARCSTGRYRRAEKLVLVMDQLNTHTAASLYEAFPPTEAKRLADRLEIHHTPKHGSWLNMAEIELSVLGRECLDRRIAQRSYARSRNRTIGSTRRNRRKASVKWQFTTADARIKLRRLYPSLHD